MTSIPLTFGGLRRAIAPVLVGAGIQSVEDLLDPTSGTDRGVDLEGEGWGASKSTLTTQGLLEAVPMFVEGGRSLDPIGVVENVVEHDGTIELVVDLDAGDRHRHQTKIIESGNPAGHDLPHQLGHPVDPLVSTAAGPPGH